MNNSSPMINQSQLAASYTSGPYAIAGHGGHHLSLHLVYNDSPGTTTLAGALTLEVSNDPRASPMVQAGDPGRYAQAAWEDITASLTGTFSLASGAGGEVYSIEGCSFSYIRAVFTYSSGTGNVKLYLTSLDG